MQDSLQIDEVDSQQDSKEEVRAVARPMEVAYVEEIGLAQHISLISLNQAAVVDDS